MAAWRLRLSLAAGAGMVLALLPAHGAGAASAATALNCSNSRLACTEVYDSEAVFGEDQYVGHDEPSVLFYSERPGSGNQNHYLLQLPKDPPTLPNGTDSGGTFNFQLHPAFWFGMAMCDTESSPNFTKQCTPDSDANIFDSTDPTSERYIGKHPGTAFMEMQFYPPGWMQWPAGNSCDVTRWCAALNIDSLSRDENTLVPNNKACVNDPFIGVEPVNFAFITKNGKAATPASPLNRARFNLDPAKDLFMNSGDRLSVDMFDTSEGFRVEIRDLTTHRQGSMTASIANGFAQVLYQPNGTQCNARPFTFHPMYSTSSEHTRVPWAAHSYNIAFSDEIGHFEYCSVVNTTNGTCTVAAGRDSGAAPDSDDVGCFAVSQLPAGSVPVAGCQDGAGDSDFDGPEYFNNWPGTLTNAGLDRKLHAQPIRFTSPTTGGHQFERAAFEADLPRIEFGTSPACDRITGANCVNPPVGAGFYPFYSTHGAAGQDEGGCNWQLGGALIPGTTNTFGGSSATEYGALLQLGYPGGPNFTPRFRFNDFRQVLASNPCQSSGSMDGGD
jgi:hypothetical protein